VWLIGAELDGSVAAGRVSGRRLSAFQISCPRLGSGKKAKKNIKKATATAHGRNFN